MPASPDVNFLLGLLALQVDFVTLDQLITGMQAWSQEKHTPLANHLVRAGALKASDNDLLQPLLQRHLERHNNDTQLSLQSLSCLKSVKQGLEKLDDAELTLSLAQVTGVNTPDCEATLKVGESTSQGSRFQVIRLDARGGFGNVFVAKDIEFGREVALKELQLRFAHDSECRSRFTREAEITGNLEHPGIVPVYGLGTYQDGRPFYAMRFIRGISFRDAIKKFHAASSGKQPQVDTNPTLEIRRFLQRFIAVCNAVQYAHSRGVVHRDIKPANIMLGPFGETLVVDWGLAKTFGFCGIGSKSRYSQMLWMGILF